MLKKKYSLYPTKGWCWMVKMHKLTFLTLQAKKIMPQSGTTTLELVKDFCVFFPLPTVLPLMTLKTSGMNLSILILYHFISTVYTDSLF